MQGGTLSINSLDKNVVDEPGHVQLGAFHQFRALGTSDNHEESQLFEFSLEVIFSCVVTDEFNCLLIFLGGQVLNRMVFEEVLKSKLLFGRLTILYLLVNVTLNDFHKDMSVLKHGRITCIWLRDDWLSLLDFWHHSRFEFLRVTVDRD